MNASGFITLSIICPGVRSVSVNEPSDAVTVLIGPSSPIALTMTPSMPVLFRGQPEGAIVLSLVLLAVALAILIGLRDRWLGEP